MPSFYRVRVSWNVKDSLGGQARTYSLDSVWLLKIPAFSSLDSLRETTTLNLKLLSYFRGLIHIASWSWQDAQEGPRQRAGPGEAVSWPRKSTMNQIWLCVYAQLRLTLCSPMDCSPPGSFVHGILQREYWNGLPFPIPGDLPNPGIESMSLMSPALAGRFFTPVHLGSPSSGCFPKRGPGWGDMRWSWEVTFCLPHSLQLFLPPCLGGQIQPLIVQRFSLGWGWGLIRKPWVWVYKGGGTGLRLHSSEMHMGSYQGGKWVKDTLHQMINSNSNSRESPLVASYPSSQLGKCPESYHWRKVLFTGDTD